MAGAVVWQATLGTGQLDAACAAVVHPAQPAQKPYRPEYQDCEGRCPTERVRRFSAYYASAELKADREVVLAAVQRNGFALRYASAELQDDDAVF